MLAQSFQSAADLRITALEHAALIKVLGMLERGELRDVSPFERCDDGFNMSVSGEGCGSPACIGGWAAFLMGVDQVTYTESYGYLNRDRNLALWDLFWNESALKTKATTEQAATALRSYLSTGDAKWSEAVA